MDRKKHFTCQLRPGVISWIKETALEREMSQNQIMELAILALQANLLAENRQLLQKTPEDNSEQFHAVK